MSLAQALDSIDRRIIYSSDERLPFDRVVLFGSGRWALLVHHFLTRRGVEIPAIVDSDPKQQGTKIHDLEVQHPDQAIAYKDLPFLILLPPSFASYNAHQVLIGLGVTDIYHGFRKNAHLFEPALMEWVGPRLEAIYQRMADHASQLQFAAVLKMMLSGDDAFLRISDYPQYEHPVVRPVAGDVILDGGSLDGDTAVVYARMTERTGTVYCFEPSEANHALLRRTIRAQGLKDYAVAVKRGLWKEKKRLSFTYNPGEAGASRLAEQGLETIEVIDVDTFVAENHLSSVDLIKMDIEGAEMDALNGARRTIARHRPKLQISLYHRLEDLWEIPELIEEIAPGYTFYFGHHQSIYTETVLYATHPEH